MKKKFNVQRLFAIIALVAMLAMFIASCLIYI